MQFHHTHLLASDARALARGHGGGGVDIALSAARAGRGSRGGASRLVMRRGGYVATYTSRASNRTVGVRVEVSREEQS